MPKWSLSDPKMTPDRPKNGPKSPQNDPILVLFWSKNGPKMVQKWPYIAPIGSKMAQNGSKRGQKGPKTVQKSSRPSSNCLKTLKIHSGPFQTHPLTAHFHRLKRRFWPFFKQNKCFIGEKGLVFAQFCIFLVNFGGSLHIFAFPCIILLNFAVNFAKHP